MDNAEATIERHEEVLGKLSDMQTETTVGLTKVATELRVTNELIERSMTVQQRVLFALLGMIASLLGIGSQMVV